MIAIIRIKGTVNRNVKVERALEVLRLKKPNHCIVVDDTPTNRGIVKKVKDQVAFGKIDLDTLSKMLKKRGRLEGNVRLNEETVKETGYETIEKLAKDVLDGNVKIKDVPKLKPYFRLTPPSKGFKSTKKNYPKGNLGNNEDKINELIEKMI